jgi:hypothetical protein
MDSVIPVLRTQMEPEFMGQYRARAFLAVNMDKWYKFITDYFITIRQQLG